MLALKTIYWCQIPRTVLVSNAKIEKKKSTHTNQSKSAAVDVAAAANRKTKAACTLHTQMTLYKFTTHQMRCFFCWLTFYELHQRRRLFEEDEKKTLEMKRAAIDIVEQRL